MVFFWVGYSLIIIVKEKWSARTVLTRVNTSACFWVINLIINSHNRILFSYSVNGITLDSIICKQSIRRVGWESPLASTICMHPALVMRQLILLFLLLRFFIILMAMTCVVDLVRDRLYLDYWDLTTHNSQHNHVCSQFEGTVQSLQLSLS